MKTLFTLILALLSVTAFAQKNFVAGTYTNRQGETKTGLIDDQNWVRNPTFIEFKRDSNSEPVKLTVADVSQFSLSTGDKYEAHEVSIDKSPTKISKLVVDAAPVIVSESVFLRAIVKGRIALYQYVDENGKEHFYIQKGDEVPEELVLRLVKQVLENKSGYIKLPIYQGTLANYFRDCPALANNKSQVRFTLSALQDAVIKYNNTCGENPQSDFVIEKEKIKFNFLALGGVSYNTLDIGTEIDKALDASEFSGTLYTAGISVMATLPRVHGKWRIQGDVMFKTFEFESSITQKEVVPLMHTKSTKTNFDFGYLGINTYVRYHILEGKLSPFITVGVANNISLWYEGSQQIYRQYAAMESTTEKEPFESYRKYEQAFLLSAGLQRGKTQLELKLERGNGFSPYTSTKTIRTSAIVQLGYVLF